MLKTKRLTFFLKIYGNFSRFVLCLLIVHFECTERCLTTWSLLSMESENFDALRFYDRRVKIYDRRLKLTNRKIEQTKINFELSLLGLVVSIMIAFLTISN